MAVARLWIIGTHQHARSNWECSCSWHDAGAEQLRHKWFRAAGRNRNDYPGRLLLSSTNAEPGECYEILVYVVRSGDTLSSISRRFGCTVKDLKVLNPGLAQSRPPLKVGQKLRVREFGREQ